MKILSLGLCLFSLTAFSQEQLAFSEIKISRDEVRQQRLFNLIEFRCSYDFPLPANQSIRLLAETFRDGKQVGRYRMSLSGGKNKDSQAKGFISVGWRKDQRELVTINDDGFLPWVARAHIPAKEFDVPELDWEFWGISFPKSLPEHRPTRYSKNPGDELTIFPVLGIPGGGHGKMNFDNIKTSADFVKACTNAGSPTAIVVYLYFSTSGDPAIRFSNK